MNQKIENIIVKYLMNEANIDELDSLTVWLRNPKNKQIFKNFVKTNYAIDVNTKQFDLENAKKEYLSKIRRDRSIFYKYKLHKIGKYAAALFIGLFATAYFFKDDLFNGSTDDNIIPIIVNTNAIVPGTDKATLTLEDGSQIALEKGASFQTSNANSNGEQIVYGKDSRKTKGLVYNYLTIPRGGQFYIVLSDGTKVWLNSESQLKYPVNFIEGKTRKVELVYGEAYFDVSPSTQHKGAKFKVFNKSQEVEVLGTAFNIKAYKDETNIYTTLVEGKVAVDYNGNKKNLVPSHQTNIDLKTKEVSVAKVDVNAVVAWKHGIFSFRGKPLKDIMKVISRWYDVEIVFENKALEELKFKGVLDKSQSIEEILSIMKSTTINNYEIKDKIILLK
ncbi:FecR family protein [Seonamhaeicola sp.]|uniref:FecR family protein n=1 Tax=Seonamhaeicola sp. TaxID=1912245 RepID=UPI00260BE1EB|nr:FecR family protein [Seonamhaeicola sp.]